MALLERPLLERPEEGGVDHRMDVVPQGSDDDLDAEELGEGNFDDEDEWNGTQK